MIADSATHTRLCPNCANSIEEDATKCNYCQADLSSHFIPQWLKRDETAAEPPPVSSREKSALPANVLWIGAIVLIASLTFLTGWYVQRSQMIAASQASSKALQARDQMIQSQEAQLAQTRQQLNENSNQLAELKSKLEQTQKELSATQQRLTVATREADRLKASRSVAVARAPSPATRASAPLPTSVARRTAAPGVYETTRTVSVYESPSSAARVVSQINRGTRINVVGSTGDWLEVRSKHGNPPGYVRSDDARLIARAN